jgi:hypothetical protein
MTFLEMMVVLLKYGVPLLMLVAGGMTLFTNLLRLTRLIWIEGTICDQEITEDSEGKSYRAVMLYEVDGREYRTLDAYGNAWPYVIGKKLWVGYQTESLEKIEQWWPMLVLGLPMVITLTGGFALWFVVTQR